MAKLSAQETFQEIALNLIDRPDQGVRMEISEVEINELAESIRELGLLQPILVHPKGDRYEVIAGDRRYLAHEKLGLETVMCIVKDIPEDEIIWLRAVENLQRKDLTPLEEGCIYVELFNVKGFTVAQIARKMGKSGGVVQRRMDILSMPNSIQKALHDGKINLGVAEELWKCPETAKQDYFLELAIEHGVTVMIVRNWVYDYKKSLRGNPDDVIVGGGGGAPFQEQPIYRACDICKGPVDYKDIIDLRLCPDCALGIREVTKTGA